jgi:hypothetical protein
MEPSDYDEIPLCKMLYSVTGTGLLAEYSRWGLTTDQIMVTVHGSPCVPSPLLLIPNWYFGISTQATTYTSFAQCTLSEKTS